MTDSMTETTPWSWSRAWSGPGRGPGRGPALVVVPGVVRRGRRLGQWPLDVALAPEIGPVDVIARTERQWRRLAIAGLAIAGLAGVAWLGRAARAPGAPPALSG